MGIEVVLITTGVFLGLMGEQWRENAEQHRLADTSLRALRTELQANRKAVAAVKDYHAEMLKGVRAYFESGTEVRIKGLQPAWFEHAAWDLALATQALAHIDPALAFSLAAVYNLQERYNILTTGITQAMYMRPIGTEANDDAFLGAVATYFSDLVFFEPELLAMYDRILPEIDRALGDSDSGGTASP
jgi:hypothetical protein